MFFITLCRLAPSGHGKYSNPVLLFTAKKGKWWCNSSIIKIEEAIKVIGWLENPNGVLVLRGQREHRRVGSNVFSDRMLVIFSPNDDKSICISLVRRYGTRKGKGKDVKQASITVTLDENLKNIRNFMSRMLLVPNKAPLLPRKWDVLDRDKYFEIKTE